MLFRTRWGGYRTAVLALLATALAACSDDPGLTAPVTATAPAAPGAPSFALMGACVVTPASRTSMDSAFAQLNDFGRIFADADNPGCAAGAAGALYDKLTAIRTQNPGWFGDEWIDGNYVAMVLAAADRIGQHGHMTAALDAQLQWVASTFKYVDEPYGCGLSAPDGCLDGYSAAAAGHAWIASYRYRHNDPSGASAARSMAQTYMNLSLKAVCIRKHSTTAGPLCDGNADSLAAGTAYTYAWNEGPQNPAYGFGLMTSIAAAVLGWEGSVSSGQYTFSAEQKTVARGLFEEARRLVAASPTLNQWPNCKVPRETSPGSWIIRTDTSVYCGRVNPTSGYEPNMYALKAFYAARLGYAPPAGGYQSNSFNPAHFDLSSSADARKGWFGYGRYVFYYELGYRWWAQPRGYMPMDAHDARGYLDRIDGGRMAHGWACDPDAPTKAVRVELRVAGAVVRGLANQTSEPALNTLCGGGSAHRFSIQLPAGTTGYAVAARALDYTYGYTDLACSQPGACVVPAPPTVQVVWVQPAEASWGQPNTLTAAGHANGGTGGVTLEWRDVTFSTNPPWNVVAHEAPLDANGSWSNTIPSPYDCHTFEVRATYFGVTTPVFPYDGRASGHCGETARMIWIQPSSTAGFGTPGAMVVAGEAKGAPPGTTVAMYYRNVTLGQGTFTRKNYDAPTDQNGIWLNDIPNANPYHTYEVFATYDVITTSRCTYTGNNANNWC